MADHGKSFTPSDHLLSLKGKDYLEVKSLFGYQPNLG